MESRTRTLESMARAMESRTRKMESDTESCTMPRMPRTMTWRVFDVGVDLVTVVMHTYSF